MKEIVLIGAPTDVGASARGCSMGPEALRVAALGHALTGREFRVVDRGKLIGIVALKDRLKFFAMKIEMEPA